MQTQAPQHDPIAVFNGYWQRALAQSASRHPSAACFSTIGHDGIPNARFIDLKSADDDGLVFGTSLESVKAKELAADAGAAITVWWESVGLQARFQGLCRPISEGEADAHWAQRSREAQLVNATLHQSAPIDDPALLPELVAAARRLSDGQAIARPPFWRGYRLRPRSIELLAYREDRLHLRTRYLREGAGWRLQHLQP